MMERRSVISGLLGLVGASAVVRAQTPPAAHKIGYLHTTTISPTNYGLSIMRPIWQRFGYVDGETVLLPQARAIPSDYLNS